MIQSWHWKTLLTLEAAFVFVCFTLSIVFSFSHPPDVLQRPVSELRFENMTSIAGKSFDPKEAFRLIAAQRSPLFRLDRKPFTPKKPIIQVQSERAVTPQLVTAPRIPPPVPAAPVAAPKNDWHQLVLKGVIISSKGSKALIAGAENKFGEWYEAGSSVTGWKIGIILKDKITLRSGDQSVDLPLYVDNLVKAIGAP